MTDGASRLGSVDVLKGILIVAIVLAHLVLSRSDVLFGGADAADPGLLGDGSIGIGDVVIQSLYLGLMAFYVISGYFYRPNRGFSDNMKRRVSQLVIATAVCAVVLPVITYAIMAACGKAPGLEDLLTAFIWGFGLNGVFEPYDVFSVHPMCGGCIGYYYVWSMVWGFLIFYAIADRVRDDWRKSMAAIVGLLIVTLLLCELFPIKLPMYAQLGPIAAAFMLAGMMLKRHGIIERIEGFSVVSWKSWILLLGPLVLVLVLVFLLPPGTDFSCSYFGGYGGYSVFPYFVEAMAMFVVLIHIAKLFSAIIGFGWAFTIAGRHTLGILLLHGSLATMFIAPVYDLPSSSWFPDSLGLTPTLVLTFGVLVISTAICFLGNELLGRRSGPSNE